MALLNQHGRVAEAIGSCVLLVRNGKVKTPPWSEGALESITIDIVEELQDKRYSAQEEATISCSMRILAPQQSAISMSIMTIAISRNLFGSVAEILAAATDAGPDTIITSPATQDAIVLKGASPAQLQPSENLPGCTRSSPSSGASGTVWC
ncbi:hypothetical protein ABIG06_007078 [Bradyrhizobium sp. USDA 326]|uniref:hypothetical protein n=1 Tax=unclassified Bradyrhizobium TaxID=2631580 RepID=UPI00351815A6